MDVFHQAVTFNKENGITRIAKGNYMVTELHFRQNLSFIQLFLTTYNECDPMFYWYLLR